MVFSKNSLYIEDIKNLTKSLESFIHTQTIEKYKKRGIVVGISNSSSFKGKIREIHDLIDDQQVLNDNLWSLIKWLSKYYNSPLGLAAKAVLPSNLSTKYKPKVETLVKALNIEGFNDSLGKAQQTIYKHLQSLDDSISVKTLSNMCSNPKDICNKLAEKGLVSLLDRPILPNLSEFAFKSENKKIRDKAIILVGFSGGFRRSELVNIDYDDIEFVSEGVKIFIKRSKTDQSGEGMTKAIPYFDNKTYWPVIGVKKLIYNSEFKTNHLHYIRN